jgi:hypothetical protein
MTVVSRLPWMWTAGRELCKGWRCCCVMVAAGELCAWPAVKREQKHPPLYKSRQVVHVVLSHVAGDLRWAGKGKVRLELGDGKELTTGSCRTRRA